MSVRCYLFSLLLFLTCWSSGVDGCTWMKSNFHVLSNTSITHLQLACRQSAHVSNVSLELPNKLYSHVTQLQMKDQLVFILRTLQAVMRLYDGQYEKSDCDQQKLQTFLLDIHRQITELERCASKVTAAEVNKKMMRKMEIHFRRLTSHLKHTEFSADGWRDVVGVVLHHLRRLDLLAIKTKQDLSVKSPRAGVTRSDQE